METIPGLQNLISSLINVNKDRVYCYEKILTEPVKLNLELMDIFKYKTIESLKYAETLSGLKLFYAYKPRNYSNEFEVVYTIWNEAGKRWKTADENGVLGACEFIEDAVMEVYKTALNSHFLTDFASREVIMDQKYSLQNNQQKIKKYRDMQKLVFLNGYGITQTNFSNL